MTESDKYVRLMTVHDWINDKKFSNKTLHRLIENKFGLKCYESRNKLIKEALAMLSKGWDKEDLRIKNAERLDYLMEQAAQEGDFKNAITAIQVQNKMFGIEVDKKEVDIKGESFEIKFG